MLLDETARRQAMEREAFREDALLLIEVAESSLAYDRSTKLRLYAEAGIPEYWVVDCLAESVEIPIVGPTPGAIATSAASKVPRPSVLRRFRTPC